MAMSKARPRARPFRAGRRREGRLGAEMTHFGVAALGRLDDGSELRTPAIPILETSGYSFARAAVWGRTTAGPWRRGGPEL
jgi:hypothetical protein